MIPGGPVPGSWGGQHAAEEEADQAAGGGGGGPHRAGTRVQCNVTRVMTRVY